MQFWMPWPVPASVTDSCALIMDKTMPTAITIPPLGVDTTVSLVSWLVAPGDTVTTGDVIAELESDKTVVELAAELSGTIVSLDVDAGTENLSEGDTVAHLQGANAAALAKSAPAVEISDGTIQEPIPVAAQPVAEPEPVSADAGRETPITHNIQSTDSMTPLARRIVERVGNEALNQAAVNGRITARNLGYLAPETTPAASGTESTRPVSATPLAARMLELTSQSSDTYRASGEDSRLMASDISLKFGQSHRSRTPADAATDADHASAVALITAPWEEVEASNVRRQIARRLQQSKQQAPHYYMSRSIAADRLIELRRTVNEELPEDEQISLNDVVVHLVANVLNRDNVLNACWTENSIRRFTRVDLAVAVAGKRGLTTPVLRDSATLGLRESARALRPLIDRAVNGTLLPEDYQGGTFTISNLGMYGVESFSAILNPPQAAILAIGAVGSELALVDAEVVSTQRFTATLSVDHRVADGIDGARFLDQFAKLSEDPRRLLL